MCSNDWTLRRSPNVQWYARALRTTDKRSTLCLAAPRNKISSTQACTTACIHQFNLRHSALRDYGPPLKSITHESSVLPFVGNRCREGPPQILSSGEVRRVALPRRRAPRRLCLLPVRWSVRCILNTGFADSQRRSHSWLTLRLVFHVESELSPKRVLEATTNCARIVKGYL
jgi:hypothetical protein